MSRAKQAATDGPRRPRPVPAPLVDARLLMLAALIASPAVYRATQGLLSPSAAVERFLVIACGCLVLSAVVRTLWPLVAGDPRTRPNAAPSTAPSAPAPAASPFPMTDPLASDPIAGLALPPVGGGFDLLEDSVDATALLDVGDYRG